MEQHGQNSTRIITEVGDSGYGDMGIVDPAICRFKLLAAENPVERLCSVKHERLIRAGSCRISASCEGP